MNTTRRNYSRVQRMDARGSSELGRRGPAAARNYEVERDRETARNRPAEAGMSWKRMDLHLHTPASSDYRDPGISYLDILRKAEERSLDMIAFADHNSVGGYAAMHREIETLTLLERLNRLNDEERTTLNEYRRLLAKVVVLPAFEFTATFGFHILGVFPENTSVRKLEYLLLDLNVPEDRMVIGAPDVGSTSDVLRAYQAITAAGGLAIAAHANSSNGVAMQGFPFGGQTKIAYTQDPNLAALEVTDWESGGRRTTASFFNGSKPEYPRRMHLMQGSDAHSLETEQADSANKRLGVGARVTEILVREASFASLKELLMGNDFTRMRPARGASPWEFAEKARQEGSNREQSFHERAMTKTSRTRPILHDAVAFANSGGGAIYVGMHADPQLPVHGLDRPEEDVRMLKVDIQRTIEPALEVDFDIKQSGARAIIVMTVPDGDGKPYVYNPTGQIFLRGERETTTATRDEIIALVRGATPSQETRLGDRPRPAAEEPYVAPSRRTGISEGEPAAATPVPAVPQTARPERSESRRGEDRDRDWGRDRDRARSSEPDGRQTADGGRRSSEDEPQPRAQRQPQPQAQPARPARSPLLANLPPEKIKGKIQPMLPTGGYADTADPASDTTRFAEVEGEETQAAQGASGLVTSPLDTDQLGQYIDNISNATLLLDEEAPTTQRRSGRNDRRRGTREAPTAKTLEAEPESTPTGVVASEQGQPAKRSRSRSKRATEAVAEAAPMEATVAAEHETREELVEKAASSNSKTSRGRSRRGKTAADEALEIGAPTAAAAATDAGAQGILTEAEMEPGPQIPAELPQEEQPATKGRSRRKKAAPEAVETQASSAQSTTAEEASAPGAAAAPEDGKKPSRRGRSKKSAAAVEPPPPPSVGVEVVDTESRNGTDYHTVRDLRNMSMVHNVTRHSTRRRSLWHYAILQHERGDPEVSEVLWHPTLPVGLWRRAERAGDTRYDMVSRDTEGKLSIYYGVTDEGLEGPWRELVDQADEVGYWGPDAVE